MTFVVGAPLNPNKQEIEYQHDSLCESNMLLKALLDYDWTTAA